jgi:hypothetical protein
VDRFFNNSAAITWTQAVAFLNRNQPHGSASTSFLKAVCRIILIAATHELESNAQFQRTRAVGTAFTVINCFQFVYESWRVRLFFGNYFLAFLKVGSGFIAATGSSFFESIDGIL